MKIFGIGLSKTGTSSLAHALEILGYRTKDYPGIERYVPGDLTSIDPAWLENFDALTDTPIPSFYRELDRAYPGAKFILTVRERESWLRSCQKQFTDKLAAKQNEAHNRLFMDLYGTPVFDREKFAAGYERFVNGVMEYFAHRPQDLLVIDITGGEGWEKLCPFLGKPIPEQPFPKANVTRIRWMDLAAIEAVARTAAESLAHLHWAMTGEGSPPSLADRIAIRARLALGHDVAIHAVLEKTAKQLSEGLRTLAPEIPVVCRLDTEVPYEQRRRWNHFWLIDPLDGEPALGQPGAGFTIDISLIEDRRPVAGVVHDPVRGETLSAMVGKGAFHRRGDGEARPLSEDTALVAKDPSASHALTLCRWIIHPGCHQQPLDACMEWHSAPAHILARMLDRRLLEVDAGKEPTYNKPTWNVPALCVRG